MGVMFINDGGALPHSYAHGGQAVFGSTTLQFVYQRGADAYTAAPQRMPQRYALILLWRYWEQRSARDVAAAIGTTEKGVERLLARARAKFKELWLKE